MMKALQYGAFRWTGNFYFTENKLHFATIVLQQDQYMWNKGSLQYGKDGSGTEDYVQFAGSQVFFYTIS